MAMNPRLLRPLATGRPLLDLFGGAAAAYSLRRLRTQHTGPVVRVRESGGNTEANFTADEVVNGTLTAFTGANNGLVVTWFDQSGNNRDATQATSTAQPTIVSSGSLVTESGKPAIQFAATASQRLHFAGSSISSLSTVSQFAVSRANDTAAVKFIAAVGQNSTGASTGLTYLDTETPRVFIWAVLDLDFSGGILTRNLLSFVVNGTALNLFVNGGSATSGTAGSALAVVNDSIGVGCTGGGINILTHDGIIQEAVIYFSDQTANRPNIRDAINSYYGIY